MSYETLEFDNCATNTPDIDTGEYEIVDETPYDISSYAISTHAAARYSTKCNAQSMSLIDTYNEMRENMMDVYKVESPNKDLCRSYKHKNKKEQPAESYVDCNGNIYITKGKKVITTYPIERIMVARALKLMKMPGYRHL